MRRGASVLLVMLAAAAGASREPQKIVEYPGTCDASAAVAVGDKLFVVGNDEDNILRVYRREPPGKPIYEYNLTPFIKPDPKDLETDIEGSARIGDRVYWITSHGRDKKGRERPSRHRFFATDVTANGEKVAIKPVGKPYSHLLQDMIAAPTLKKFHLAEAAAKAPDVAGGLNIEGLAAMPDGMHLLIGFRNPVPDSKALIVPLLNPEKMIEGHKAHFGDPSLVDLDGRGIRSIEYIAALKSYFIIAGPIAHEGTFALYRWPGVGHKASKVESVEFGSLHPEALFVFPSEPSTLQILSDDGSRTLGDTNRKSPPPEKRSFRSIQITP